MRVDGAVGARPVNGQTQGGEEVFEDLLVFNRELFTEFNEAVAEMRGHFAWLRSGLEVPSAFQVIRSRKESLSATEGSQRTP